MDITRLLIKHEGMRLKPYRDTVGKLTIGVGRNLDDVGISEEEAILLLTHDIDLCEKQLSNLPWYHDLSHVRKDVLIDMVFNMGFRGMLSFKRMIIAIENHNWTDAATQMLDSKWAVQVGRRARELAYMMENDRYMT